MTNKEKEPCCSNFKEAREVGSDNEMCGRAIYYDPYENEFSIGAIQAPIKNCPWCGSDLG
jgi:hypothetical protein